MATKGEQSATKNGEKFQNQIWDLSEEDKKILFNTDDISCLVDTDSKVLNFVKLGKNFNLLFHNRKNLNTNIRMKTSKYSVSVSKNKKYFFQ